MCYARFNGCEYKNQKRGENRCAQHTYDQIARFTRPNCVHNIYGKRNDSYKQSGSVKTIACWYKCSNHIQNAEQHISLTAMTKTNRDRSHSQHAQYGNVLFRCWWRSSVVLLFSLLPLLFHNTQTKRAICERCNIDTVDCIYFMGVVSFIFMRYEYATDEQPSNYFNFLTNQTRSPR